MKKLFSAASIIERDSLQARLQEAGIASVSPARDMSRKVTNDTVDLALNGYSVFFDGFTILVEDNDFAKGEAILKEFLAERDMPLPESEIELAPHWRRFYFCSVFSILFPVLLNFAALYHLYKAIHAGERPRTGYLILSIVCLVPGFLLAPMIIHSLIDVFR